jgi:proton-translocating NADH-quinone oxidoreductase chain N
MFGDTTLNLALTLWQLSPELILLLTGLVILLVDALRPREADHGWVPYAALAGLVVSLAACVTLMGQAPTTVLAVMTLDGLTLVAKMLALVSVGMVVLFSGSYMQEHSRHLGEFYALLLFATLAITLIVGASDLVLIFLSVDFLSITSYVLTGYLREDRRSSEAAIKYFLYGAALSAVMLYGMSLLFGLTGSTGLNTIAARLGEGTAEHTVVLPALIFVLAGLGFKVAAVPFHQWAPDAYEGAPTPVTAFLSLGPKVAGFAVLARFLMFALPQFQIDWTVLLLALSVTTMTVGNLIAIWQKNIKRLLAYSSIAQAGYAMIGLVTVSSGGIASLLFYLAVYLFANLGAFAVVVAVSLREWGEQIEDYHGLSQRSPSLALTMLLFLLSLAGIPPLAGFVGKVNLFIAAVSEGLIWLVVVAVINSVVSLYYYLQVARMMYLFPPTDDEPMSVPRPVRTTILIAVAGVLVLGIYPSLLLPFIQLTVGALVPGSSPP